MGFNPSYKACGYPDREYEESGDSDSAVRPSNKVVAHWFLKHEWLPHILYLLRPLRMHCITHSLHNLLKRSDGAGMRLHHKGNTVIA